MLKINKDGVPFEPCKFVRWFSDAYDAYRADGDVDGYAASEAWDLYENESAKVREEFAEVEAADCDILTMSDEAAINLLGECADLVQATIQKMYMIGAAHGVSVAQVFMMTKLKCLSRDEDFYGK